MVGLRLTGGPTLGSTTGPAKAPTVHPLSTIPLFNYSTSHYSTTIQLSALLYPTIHYHPLTCYPTFDYPIIIHYSTIHLTTIYQFSIIQYPTIPLPYLSLSTIFLPYLSLSTIFLSTLLLPTIQVNTYYPSVPVPPPLYNYPRRRTAHFKHSFFLPLSYFKVDLPKAPSMFSTFWGSYKRPAPFLHFSFSNTS